MRTLWAKDAVNAGSATCPDCKSLRKYGPGGLVNLEKTHRGKHKCLEETQRGAEIAHCHQLFPKEVPTSPRILCRCRARLHLPMLRLVRFPCIPDTAAALSAISQNAAPDTSVETSTLVVPLRAPSLPHSRNSKSALRLKTLFNKFQNGAQRLP
jgi:hypothetical protein